MKYIITGQSGIQNAVKIASAFGSAGNNAQPGAMGVGTISQMVAMSHFRGIHPVNGAASSGQL
jgi:hypothetical protein